MANIEEYLTCNKLCKVYSHFFVVNNIEDLISGRCKISSVDINNRDGLLDIAGPLKISLNDFLNGFEIDDVELRISLEKETSDLYFETGKSFLIMDISNSIAKYKLDNFKVFNKILKDNCIYTCIKSYSRLFYMGDDDVKIQLIKFDRVCNSLSYPVFRKL